MIGTADKVMLLGQIGVGKSSLAHRLVFDRFESTYKPTIGVDVYRYQPEDGASPRAPMIVWDSDGNLGDAMFKHVYLKEASAAIVIGDITRSETIEQMVSTAAAFRASLPGRVTCFIVNKIDLTNGAGVELPEALTLDESMLFYTSALTGENVQQAFAATSDAIARRTR